MLWEYEFLTWIQGLQCPVLNKVMAFLSILGNQGAFWVVLGFFLFIYAKTRPTGYHMLLAMLLAFIIGNLILKKLIDRPRPYEIYETLQPLVSKPADASFPSGHTMNSFSAATSIFLKHKKAGAAALVLASLIAFSRLYNLVHFPTDVFGGLAIGVGCAITLNQLLKRRLLQNVR